MFYYASTMKYLSDFVAIKYWGIPWARNYFAEEITQTQKFKYLVRNEKDRFYTAQSASFTFSHELPDGALDHKRGVVTPPLLFIQLANELDLIKTILFGCMLCSRPDYPWSEPFLSKKKLTKFVEEATRYPGRKKALQALQYVEEGACSIMEIFVHLLLGLPNNLGGLGIKGGIFNYPIELNDAGKKALNQDFCYIDYYFPEQKVGFEYQGAYHNGSMDFDSVRRAALDQMGHKIITVTKIQVYDSDKTAQLLQLAQNALGKKSRIRTDNYLTRQRQIIDALPRPRSQS